MKIDDVDEPDYSQYSLEELREAAQSINRKAYPERYVKIKKILDQPVASGFYDEVQVLEHKQQQQQEVKKGYFWSAIVLWCYGLYMLYTGDISYRRSHYFIEQVEVRIAVFLVIYCVAYSIYKKAYK